MDEHVRLRMRRAHAQRSQECACGRKVFGNGAKSHFRACRTHLTERGYPLDQGMQRAVFSYGGMGALHRAEHGLARMVLGNPKALTGLGWSEFKALIYKFADEEATP